MLPERDVSNTHGPHLGRIMDTREQIAGKRS